MTDYVPEDIETIIPHAQFGAPECRGLLAGKPGEDLSEISCNECGAVLAYIVPEDLRRVLAENGASTWAGAISPTFAPYASLPSRSPAASASVAPRVQDTADRHNAVNVCTPQGARVLR
jgi:hypothetical protein